MQSLATDLWVDQQPLRFVGVEIGTRMTVIRLPTGRLWIHSPIEATPERLEAVRALGEPAALIAPTRFHHLFIGDWRDAFPAASLHLAPGLESKRPDLMPAEVLGDDSPKAWAGNVEQVAVKGFPLANEVVFYHPATATLVATDLAFNLSQSFSAPTRFAMRLAGVKSRLSPTLLERFGIRDRTAFRSSLDRILEWPFERVIVAHGDVVEAGGKEALAEGYAFLR
ncbi:MAG: DUF4336 domain-containing protein [bacterium]|nr:DUF4336 domain-containing protein [bacterium]